MIYLDRVFCIEMLSRILQPFLAQNCLTMLPACYYSCVDYYCSIRTFNLFIMSAFRLMALSSLNLLTNVPCDIC